MRKLNIAQFAVELGLPVALLLEQLKAAGVRKFAYSDLITEQDKVQLLDYLRQAHVAGKNSKKITLNQLRAKVREQDETKKPRITLIDKSTASTTMRATKMAGATKQGSDSAGKSYAKGFNAKFKKVKEPVAVNANSIKRQQNKPNRNSLAEKVDVKPATTKSTPKAKKVNKNISLGIFNAIEEAYKFEAKKMPRPQLRREIEQMQRRSKTCPSDASNNVRLMKFKEIYGHPGVWQIRVRSTS